MSTRHISYKIQTDGGLLIPASAAVGKRLASDAEGNATWKKLAVREFPGWGVEGAIGNKTFIPWICPELAEFEVLTLVAVVYKLGKGTIEFEVKKNTEVVTGYKAAEVKATSTAKTVKGTATELKEKDQITVTSSSGAETPENMTFQLVLEKTFL